MTSAPVHAEKVLQGDEYDAELLAQVRPGEWKNPVPAPSYNLVVIGAGPAGLVIATGAAALGARVALVEKNLMGGDCLNVGCVPSKALLRTALFYADLRRAAKYGGGRLEKPEVDFGRAMERMRSIRTHIGHQDSARRLCELGVDVFFGEAAFAGPRSVRVAGATLNFRKAAIATGSRAAAPSIEGLAEAGYLTNETVFNLTERPARLMVIGGGPLGCELAQAFARLGCAVTIAQNDLFFLQQEERDAAELLAQSLARDGIQVRLNTEVTKVSLEDGARRVHLVSYDQESIVSVDQILVGVGRSPNVEGLDLEAAGVAYDLEKGVHVDDFMRTSNRRIYAAGDVALENKFTHVADATGRIVVENALFLGRKRLSALTIPWCTYTDPAIAHVGIYVREARERGIPVETFTVPMSEVDRAITDSEEDGFAKIHVRQGTDRILGATVVARHAGEMINEITLAMVAGIGLRTVSRVIHSYPTQAEAIRKAADAYSRTRLTPFWKRVAARWLA